MTTAADAPALHWDPFDTAIKADPHPVWRRLRDEAPVYRNDEFDFWAYSRFDDVDAAHRDPRTYSSARGTVLEFMADETFDGGTLMIFLDPPEHTHLRRLVSRAFTARRVAEIEDDVRRLCTSLLDALDGRDRFDFVADYGALIPATVIATLFGVPPADREWVRETIDGTFHLEPGLGMNNPVAHAAMGQLHAYVTAQLDERRSQPRDDLFSALLEAEVETDDGGTRRLNVEESAMFSILLVEAGTETVARLIGWAGALLSRHPDERALLVEDPALIPGAVEELLRYEAPSPVQGRTTTVPVERHGVAIPAGSKVLLLTGSAGRDPRAYPDADRFDVRRRVDRHLSFGFGPHLCLGAALARLEGRVALETVLARHPSWEADLDAATMLYTSTVRGYSSLPVGV